MFGVVVIFVIFVIIAFLGTMVTSAIVFLEVTSWAVAHVEIEFLAHGFSIWSHFDADYGRVIIPFREALI